MRSLEPAKLEGEEFVGHYANSFSVGTTCYSSVLERLQKDCDDILSDSRVKQQLALLFADCFQQINGLSRYPCMAGADRELFNINECIRQINPDVQLFNIYTSYFNHLDSVCYYYQSDIWRAQTAALVETLRTTAVNVSQGVAALGNDVADAAKELQKQQALHRQVREETSHVADSVTKLAEAESKRAEAAAARAWSLSTSMQAALGSLLELRTEQEEARAEAAAALNGLGAGIGELSDQGDALLATSKATGAALTKLALLATEHADLLEAVAQSTKALESGQLRLRTLMQDARSAAEDASEQAQKAKGDIQQVAEQQRLALEAASRAAREAEKARDTATAAGAAAASAIDRVLEAVTASADQLAEGNKRLVTTQETILRALDGVRIVRGPAGRRWALVFGGISAAAFAVPLLRTYWVPCTLLAVCAAFGQSAAARLPARAAQAVVPALWWAFIAASCALLVGDLLGLRAARAVMTVFSAERRHVDAEKRRVQNLTKLLERAAGEDEVFDELSTDLGREPPSDEYEGEYASEEDDEIN